MKKVYLNTPEEVIKALKEGKEVLGGETGLKYTLMDGFIIGKLGNDFSVGTNIIHKEKPFILEEEPLKIEVGKFYKTRNGKKARCFFKYTNGIFKFTIDFCCDTFEMRENGKCCGSLGTEFPLDIIGPWDD